MTIQEYIDSLNKRFKTGISREHTYRTDLEQLIRTIVKGVEITNDPSSTTTKYKTAQNLLFIMLL